MAIMIKPRYVISMGCALAVILLLLGFARGRCGWPAGREQGMVLEAASRRLLAARAAVFLLHPRTLTLSTKLNALPLFSAPLLPNTHFGHEVRISTYTTLQDSTPHCGAPFPKACCKTSRNVWAFVRLTEKFQACLHPMLTDVAPGAGEVGVDFDFHCIHKLEIRVRKIESDCPRPCRLVRDVFPARADRLPIP